MNTVTQNIQNCHRQTDKLKAILLLLENAYLERNSTDIAYYSSRYADQLQKMAAPHIEEALSDEELNALKDEVFAADMVVPNGYEGYTSDKNDKIRITMHEEMGFPKQRSKSPNLSY